MVPKRAEGQAGQEALQRMELDQLIGRPTRGPGLRLQAQVGLTTAAVPRHRAHSSTSRV